MSSLTSTSTYAEVKAAYYDNASYEEDVSVTKAAAFITACRFLLQQDPKKAGWRDSATTEWDPEVLERQMAEARDWKAAQATVTTGGPGVTYADFTNFRD
jgi:molybdopterin biosynthesis enzyme MoaB